MIAAQVTRAHGSVGVVRAKFRKNLPPSSLVRGHPVTAAQHVCGNPVQQILRIIIEDGMWAHQARPA